MKHKKEIYLIIFLVLSLIVINYNFVDSFLERNLLDYEMVEVERVVDGDTVIVNGSSARLLGINTPEKGERYYLEAKEFLESRVMNKTLRVEFYGKDRYYRDLVYLFDSENINLEVVRQGYGNYYFPVGKERYYDDFVLAWSECLSGDFNLCEKSVYYGCVSLKEMSFETQEIALENICTFDIDFSSWEMKDEGRKKYVFEDFVLNSGSEVIVSAEDFEEDYVWTKTGDSLFLRDSERELVLFESF